MVMAVPFQEQVVVVSEGLKYSRRIASGGK